MTDETQPNAAQADDWFDPEATTFGDRIAGAREAAGMTQKQLAQRVGVKLKTLKAWENDLSEPRANRVSIMAGLLNVSLTWLLSGQGQGPEMPDADSDQRDLAAIMVELRSLRAEALLTAERLGQLEKSLRRVSNG